VYAVETHSVQKVYRGVFGGKPQQALAGVDLSVPSGSAFGLIGPNGAGKTTFIKTLLSIVRPTGGSVRVLEGDPDDPAVRARIGYLPERLQLPEAWTPVAFLESVARLKRVRSAGAEVKSALERIGLAADSTRRLGTLSKGMRRRVGLAAALLGRPELLILDEPTDGIDPLGRIEIRRILLEESRRGATLFINSHLLAETERICDRVGILSRGRLVREGTLDELCSSGTRWRIRFAPHLNGFDPASLGFTAAESRGVWWFTGADSQALNAALDGARARGAVLIELSSESSDLEQLLARAVEGT
jgi:ABC-2 type transport system ATP-binding protein